MADPSGLQQAIKALGECISPNEAARVLRSYISQARKIDDPWSIGTVVSGTNLNVNLRTVIKKVEAYCQTLDERKETRFCRPSKDFNEIIFHLGILFQEVYAAKGAWEVIRAANEGFVTDLKENAKKVFQWGGLGVGIVALIIVLYLLTQLKKDG